MYLPAFIPNFKLLAPEDGSKLNAFGRVTFTWVVMPGAATYRPVFNLPNGQMIYYDSYSTSRELYIESLNMGGLFV